MNAVITTTIVLEASLCGSIQGRLEKRIFEDNDIGATLLAHARKPPYVKRHVRWCERTVALKVGTTSCSIFLYEIPSRITFKRRFREIYL
ncbi:MAG: hypothetical protein K5787_18780 [Lentisphaeria bacterium]|nr:hypothetical protein [Lentisphaeria bacterium]